ncbi:MAG: helix-hairpin-helix domain-containing protein [Candidatus Aenigmarchaeota archaeon]|nr:helix-hairpin-helix domain-containing protein [Candidatus Aenigmarchaeota archaeon]
MNIIAKIMFFVITAVYILGAPFALATTHTVNLDLTTTTAAVCPSNTEHIIGTIENTGTEQDTYTLTADNEWATIAPDKITLNSGQKSEFHIYITPSDINAEPTEYPIEIKAFSLNAQDSETITLDILKCHGVGIVFDKTVDTSCLTDRAIFTMEVTNYGTVEETFDLTTTSGVLSKKTVVLDSGMSEIVELSVDVTKEKENVFVEAQSRTSYAKITEIVDVVGVNCYDAKLNVFPETKTMCVDEDSTYTVEITNHGTKDDTYTLETNFGELTDIEVNIPAGETKTTTLTVLPTDIGDYDLNVAANSIHTVMSAKAKLSSINCKGIAVLAIPPELSVCKGSTARYLITMKNIGSRADTFTIETNMGTIVDSVLDIDSGEVKDTYLEIDTNGLDFTTYDFTVTAESTIEDSVKGTLVIENCYSLDISVEEKTKSVCPAKDARYLFTLKNTGKNDDTYNLSVDTGLWVFSEYSVIVDAFSEKTVELYIATDFEDAMNKELCVTVASLHVLETEDIVIGFKEKSECYGYSMSINPAIIETEEYKGYIYTATITNTGLYESEYSFDVDGPEWVTVAPETTAINAGEKDETFIYAAPPYGTATGAYTITLSSKNKEGIIKSATVQMTVGGATPEDIPVVDDEPIDLTETETYAADINTTEEHVIDNETISIATASYTTVAGVRKSFDIGFETGSFIVHISDTRVEYENPEIGENIYEVLVENTLYEIAIDFIDANTTTNTYAFNVVGVEVTENYEAETTVPVDEVPEESKSSSKLIYAIVVGIIIILLILFGPEAVDLLFKDEEEEKQTFGIAGIGPKREATLKKEGIATVEELSKSDASDVATILGVSSSQAKKYINAAAKKVRATKKEEKKEEKPEEKEKPARKKKEEKEVKDEIKDILDNI